MTDCFNPRFLLGLQVKKSVCTDYRRQHSLQSTTVPLLVSNELYSDSPSDFYLKTRSETTWRKTQNHHVYLSLTLSRWLAIETVEQKFVFPLLFEMKYYWPSIIVLLELTFNSSFHWVTSIWCGGSGALCCLNGLADRREWDFSSPTAMGRTPQEGRWKLHFIPWRPEPLSPDEGMQHPCSAPIYIWGSFLHGGDCSGPGSREENWPTSATRPSSRARGWLPFLRFWCSFITTNQGWGQEDIPVSPSAGPIPLTPLLDSS